MTRDSEIFVCYIFIIGDNKQVFIFSEFIDLIDVYMITNRDVTTIYIYLFALHWIRT